MNLDEIKEMWSSDCKIDDIELDKSSLEVPKLHSKYSDLLTENVMKVKGLEMQYHILLKDKWLWFNGKLDQDKLKSYGWEDDPFDGLKIMKNDTVVQEINLPPGTSSRGYDQHVGIAALVRVVAGDKVTFVTNRSSRMTKGNLNGTII